MRFQRFRPVAPLSRYVESIYFLSRPAAGAQRHLISPNALMDFVIHLENRELAWFLDGKRFSVIGPLLAGPYSRPFFADLSQSTAMLGVRFHPGAARRFFPVPAHELHNLDIALADLHQAESDRLIDQILSASSLRYRVAILQRYLVDRLTAAKAVDGVVEHAVGLFRQSGSLVSVKAVESTLGLSHTRFIQIFREGVGMTPKLFCRVQRFQNTLRRMEQDPAPNWARIAADCGYFDQAHMIRDFREFAGMTPLAYCELCLPRPVAPGEEA